MKARSTINNSATPKESQFSLFALYRDGYVINLLNPKIAIFYVSIFSQFAQPNTPSTSLMIFSGQMVIQSALYWSTFAALTRANILRSTFSKSPGSVDLAFGISLVFLQSRYCDQHHDNEKFTSHRLEQSAGTAR